MSHSFTASSRWVALALLATTQFFLILDTAIVLVALPSIGNDLNFAPENLSWVVNAYMLTFGGLLMLGGRAADLLGRRRLFMIGLILFAGASLAGALATSALWLIIARSLQGVGAAIVSPAALSLVMTLFTVPAERNKALGIWVSVAGMGAAAGAILGGFLTEWFGWQAVLWVNVPIAVIAVALAPRFLPEGRSEVRQRSFDFGGAITVTGGLAVLIYALVDAGKAGWGSGQTLGLLGLAVALLIAFVTIEARSAQPLIPLRIFRLTALRNANLLTLLATSSMFSLFFFLTLYSQQVLGYTPIQAGLVQLPVALAFAFLATPVSKLVTRIGYKVPSVTGLLLMGAGLLWFSRIPADGTYLTDVMAPSLLATIGATFAVIPLMIAATSRVSDNEAGLASGLINTTQQVGGALGVAVLTTLATSVTTNALTDGTNAPQAMTDGFSAGLMGAAGIVWGAALLAILLFARRRGGTSSDITAETSDTTQEELSRERVATLA
ncbi:MAG: MFS transporter [Acidimicrobiales bacterium]|nr:MAG: MFS transporter [Acidimicrobiales bacterium]